jgi:two-component system, cell cycle response regulator
MSLMILSNEIAVPAMDSQAAVPEDLAELAEENAALKREICRLSTYRALAFRDALTGLHNRRAFSDRLAEECARTRRQTEYTFSVVLIDLDEFKSINDTLGHAEGDRVLVAVARFLERNTRAVDVCCRIGGDEFGVILPDTDEGGRRAVVDRLRHAIRPAIDGKTERIGMSVGVATCPPEIPDADRVVAAADKAMYRDKERRKALRRTA